MRSEITKPLNLENRRFFLERAAKYCLGVTVGSSAWKNQRLLASARSTACKSIIYLFMRGGMSHLDTFDPKPQAGADIQGPVKSIASKVPGTQLTEYLPKTAMITDRIALIRSMCHNQGAHEPGEYLIRTGFEKQTGIVHPSLGAWCSELGSEASTELPSYVRIGDLGGHPANGFFEVRSGPVPISNPTQGLNNIKLAKSMTLHQFEQGRQLTTELDREFVQRYDQASVRAYGDLYDDAVRLMQSRDLSAFDLTQESRAIRERYGSSSFGQGCLLARRLIEKEVGFIEVDFGDWDTHVANHTGVQELCRTFDQTYSTLIQDLVERGLFDSTLVVVATEFGRMPEIDEFGGRGHWPRAFTCLLAGSGIQGGAVHGVTDDRAEEIVADEVSVLDFNTTIAKIAGISLTAERAATEGGQVYRVTGKDNEPQGQLIEKILI
jgi:hypothetical protein